jgi:hypothetical protein
VRPPKEGSLDGGFLEKSVLQNGPLLHVIYKTFLPSNDVAAQGNPPPKKQRRDKQLCEAEE